MKYINIKRIILNIAMLLLFGACVLIGISMYTNRVAVYTDAVITSSEPSGNSYYQDSNGNRTMYDDITVSYIVDGQTYEGSAIKLPGDYEIGATVKYCYNRNHPEQRFYDTRKGDFGLFGSIALVAIIVIVICRGAFQGYWTDYICRYKKQVVFSMITGWIPVLYYLWFEYIFEPVGLFPGLGEYLFLLFLIGFVPVVNIIVWIVAAVKYAKGRK